MAIRGAVLATPGFRCRTELTLDGLPFAPGDVTAGSEDELQAVVVGPANSCDLPLTIRESRFFNNIARRSSSGETSRTEYLDLQAFLNENETVWENSWVRFPEHRLSPHALNTFLADLKIGEQGQLKRCRLDSVKFTFEQAGETWLRVPISYALKLALADVVGTQPHLPESMRLEAKRLMRHFSNDNTSPETTSFKVVGSSKQVLVGEAVARESARRFLFTSLLMAWANQRFGLREAGQRAMVYHAPHPPVRQAELSSTISDSFYRELFMSPCLSGWDDGEAKADYMHLCHQVLSRSQLNSVAKLREAGIISNNLIVLPTLSNVSLANNGIHITYGSRSLTRAIADHRNEVDGHSEEKRLGDLAIKIYEHFLALFVGTYSAAPHRIDFADFHPEKLLSFLPHELDFTHLRLMWREWKEKASMRVLGRVVAPYGPPGIDNFRSRLFGLRGDLVPDYRLLNYPVAWLATERSSALDGKAGNVPQLMAELDELGIVDKRVAFYMPLRLREFRKIGFSGFEGRYYSLFPSYHRDMAQAADLQQLLLMMAYRLALEGIVEPHEIPDNPTSESERRQPFFFAAAGLPAFYVQKNTRNQFLRQILRHCKRTRSSWRHPDYLRVSIRDYCEALLIWLEQKAIAIVDQAGARLNFIELRYRLADEAQQAHARIIKGLMKDVNADPLRIRAREFNLRTEHYYRETLRRSQLREACAQLREDAQTLDKHDKPEIGALIRHGVRVQDLVRFLDNTAERLVNDELSPQEIATLLNLLLVLNQLDSAGSA